MQVLATTVLSVHNLLNTHFAGPLQLKEFNFSYSSGQNKVPVFTP